MQNHRGNLIAKRLIVLAMFLVAGCTAALTGSPEAPTLVSSSGIPVTAIYLVQGNGQLSQEDLQAHPEVIATANFDEFKSLAKSKVALWIDINSVGLVDKGWLGKSPQMFYPVAVIGDSNPYCVFFGYMQYFRYEVPPPSNEDECSAPRPGFSVNQLTSGDGGRDNGYEEAPTVQGILDRTDPLLERVQ